LFDELTGEDTHFLKKKPVLYPYPQVPVSSQMCVHCEQIITNKKPGRFFSLLIAVQQ